MPTNNPRGTWALYRKSDGEFLKTGQYSTGYGNGNEIDPTLDPNLAWLAEYEGQTPAINPATQKISESRAVTIDPSNTKTGTLIYTFTAVSLTPAEIATYNYNQNRAQAFADAELAAEKVANNETLTAEDTGKLMREYSYASGLIKAPVSLIALALSLFAVLFSSADAREAWRVIRIETSEVLRESRTPIAVNEEGEPITPPGLDPALAIYRVSYADPPPFDPRTHTLASVEIPDHDAKTIEVSYTPQLRERAEIEEQIRLEASRRIASAIGDASEQRRQLLVAMTALADVQVGDVVDLGRGGTRRSERARKGQAADTIAALAGQLNALQAIENERDAKLAQIAIGQAPDLDAWP